ncbi:hypothetical protein TNCV_4490431 [Trichonephila clavipes]|nr:hypothetical protein TNCV_4490431 [Trichonephila clavipes]
MFTRRSQLPVGLTPVTIFGQPVPWVNVAKYLGLFLDAKLTFAYHIEQTRKKAIAVHAMLKKLISRRRGSWNFFKFQDLLVSGRLFSDRPNSFPRPHSASIGFDQSKRSKQGSSSIGERTSSATVYPVDLFCPS